jgi:hypothetical protein
MLNGITIEDKKDTIAPLILIIACREIFNFSIKKQNPTTLTQ